MASATQVAACPPCGPDAVLCCRALVMSTWQDSWQQGPSPETARDTSVPQVFSTRKPRDAIAGLSSGLKTFARSVAAGSAALVCTPMEAAKEDGSLLRTFQGVCEGVATAAILPCAGAALAAVQFTRGVALTPQAVVEVLRGQQWNESERCWKPLHYSLDEEAAHLKKKKRQKAKAAGSRRSRATSANDGERVRVHGREYYGLLRVNPTASYVEIRRAYYRESRRCHPDKAGADPQMVERFQQLSQAYQVLRNAELRQAYDAGGQEAVARLSATIDLGSLYAAVLSGSQWEPYVGRLALSHILSGQDENTGPDTLSTLMSIFFSEDSTDPWQAEREVQCALTLVAKLRPMEDSDVESFATAVRHEASTLAEVPFAPAVLYAMAGVYEAEAARFLGAFSLRTLTLGREFRQTQAQGHLMIQQARAAGAGTQALLALRSLLAEEARPTTESASSSEEPRATALCLERPAVQEQLPCLASALWQFTVLDVEGTLRRVCRRVLSDTSVSFECRQLRAEALQLMAQVLREVADARGQMVWTGSPGDDKTLLLNKISEEAALMMSSRGQDAEYGGTSTVDSTNA